VWKRRLEDEKKYQEALEHVMDLELLRYHILYRAESVTLMRLKLDLPRLGVEVVQMSRPDIQLLYATPSSAVKLLRIGALDEAI
jgi:hypothetical protein